MSKNTKPKRQEWQYLSIETREDIGMALVDMARTAVEADATEHRVRVAAAQFLFQAERRTDVLHHHAMAMLAEMYEEPLVAQYLNMVRRDYYIPKLHDPVANPRSAKLL